MSFIQMISIEQRNREQLRLIDKMIGGEDIEHISLKFIGPVITIPVVHHYYEEYNGEP